MHRTFGFGFAGHPERDDDVFAHGHVEPVGRSGHDDGRFHARHSARALDRRHHTDGLRRVRRPVQVARPAHVRAAVPGRAVVDEQCVQPAGVVQVNVLAR